MSARVARWIRGYERVGDAVAVEYPLPKQWDLAALQLLFELPADDPLVDSFPIGPRQAAALLAGVEAPIDVSVYDFFLEAIWRGRLLLPARPSRTGPWNN
jgi:hypothetical protein